MIKKPTVLVFVIILFIAAFITVLISGKDTSIASYEVTVKNPQLDIRYDLTSDKDGFVGNFYGNQDNKIILTNGKHEVTAKSGGYKDVVVKLEVPNNTSFEISFSKTNAEVIAKEYASTQKDITVAKSRLFLGDTWLVSLVSSGSYDSEIEIMVAKKVRAKWETIQQGSYIDTDLLASENVPTGVIDYVKELQ